MAETSRVAPREILMLVEFAMDARGPSVNVPLLMVVLPLYGLALVNTHRPGPLLVSEVGPPVPSPRMGAKVFAPVFVPVSVKVRAPLPENATRLPPLPARVRVPVPEASNAPPL